MKNPLQLDDKLNGGMRLFIVVTSCAAEPSACRDSLPRTCGNVTTRYFVILFINFGAFPQV